MTQSVGFAIFYCCVSVDCVCGGAVVPSCLRQAVMNGWFFSKLSPAALTLVDLWLVVMGRALIVIFKDCWNSVCVFKFM